MNLRTLLLYLGRLVPAIGLIHNRLRSPGLHVALHVEIQVDGVWRYGQQVTLGEGTRIDVAGGGSISLGAGISISRRSHISAGANQTLVIGNGTTVQDNCRIYGDVNIGQRCILAPNIFITSGTHVFDMEPHLPIQEQERLAPRPDRSVVVHDDCWLGINTVLTPGVVLGRGCIVGANSVVTNNLPPYSIAVGAPARAVARRLDFAPPHTISAMVPKHRPYFYRGFDLFDPSPDTALANTNFTLALSKAGSQYVLLEIDGQNGWIKFHDQVAKITPARQSIIFRLQEETAGTPFLDFCTQYPCRIFTAQVY